MWSAPPPCCRWSIDEPFPCTESGAGPIVVHEGGFSHCFGSPWGCERKPGLPSGVVHVFMRRWILGHEASHQAGQTSPGAEVEHETGLRLGLSRAAGLGACGPVARQAVSSPAATLVSWTAGGEPLEDEMPEGPLSGLGQGVQGFPDGVGVQLAPRNSA